MSFAIKPYIELCRVSNLLTVWTNVLAAVVLTGEPFSLTNYFILTFSMSLFYAGGMSLNDICDVETDRVKKSFRPIPSRNIHIKSAYKLTLFLFALALSLLLTVPFLEAFFAGLFLLLLIIVYDIFHKASPLSVILMAACRLMVFVITSIAILGNVGLIVLTAGLLQFIYTLIISIVARYENTRNKSYSLPVIPIMISCISLLDGIIMSVFTTPYWLIAGIIGTILTLFLQIYIKGD